MGDVLINSDPRDRKWRKSRGQLVVPILGDGNDRSSFVFKAVSVPVDYLVTTKVSFTFPIPQTGIFVAQGMLKLVSKNINA